MSYSYSFRKKLRCILKNPLYVATKMFAILIFIVTVLIQQLHSCGVSTHISIANEALQSFTDNGHYNVSYRDIILENSDAFFAGSNYPDAMYTPICFGGHYHSVSEDTHWAPFLNTTVTYIRKTFPKPWNKATRKLIAFTFGVVSHQVADITWHSLGIDQGFLQTMAKINFHGSFSTAHPWGDYGGDMVSMFEGDLQDVFSSERWYIPAGDLVNIYKELYGEEKIGADVILSCSFILYAQWIGEKLAGADLFSIFAHKSPFLVEELHDYYLGGKSDMAAWSSIIWNETTRMFENGPETCDIPKSTIHLRCNPARNSISSDRKEDNKLKYRPRISLMYFKKVNELDVTTTRTSRGVYLSIKGKTAAKVRAAKKRFLTSHSTGDINNISKEKGVSKPFAFFTKNKYARLGWSLIPGQLTGLDHVLIAGAPWYGNPGNSQHGRVYILSANMNYTRANYTDIDQTANQILDGNVENSRFGFAVAVVDFNADGINDLAISAPSEGSNYLNYTGKVYIYYGNGIRGVNSKPDAVITGDQRYFNLGTCLVAADVNMDGFKDLIIGSRFSPMGGEQRGSVAVFFSGKRKNDKGTLHYFAHQANWLLKGEQNYSWFGYQVAFHNKTSIGPVLIVSAPTYRICALKNCSQYSLNDTQSVGKLYAYQWSTKNAGTSKLLFEVTGKVSFGKLGTSLAIGDPFGSGQNDILAVSSPSAVVNGHLPSEVPATFDQAGQVFLLSLKTLAYKRKVMLPETDYVTLFEGNRDYSRFGWDVSWQDVNGDDVNDLILGSPYQAKDPVEVGGGEGAVYIFYGGKSFPRGDATRNCDISDVEPCPERIASEYFLSNQKSSQFGRNVVAMEKFANAPSVIVSSPRLTVTSLHNGAIFVIPHSNKGPVYMKRIECSSQISHVVSLCCVYKEKIESFRSDRNGWLKSIHAVEWIDLRFKQGST